MIVEGKSDYYILNWYKMYHATGVTLDFVPVNGVSNARALLSLYLGWCSAFVFLLDADSEGRDAKERYLNELPLRENQVLDYEEIFGNGKDSPSRIEDLLSSDFKQQIARHFSISRVNKKHIQRAFAEALYGTNPFALDCLTGENLHKVVSALEKRLSSQ